MKKQRGWLAVLLCVTLLVCFLPSTALAAKPRVAGVDYDELWAPEDNALYSADVIIGNQTFFGHLERELALTDDEIDDVLRQTLREMNITEGTLLRCNSDIFKADKIKGFNTKKAMDMLATLLGVDTAVDVFKYMTGSGKKSAADIALDYSIDQGIETLADAAVEKVGGKLAAKAATQFGGFALTTLLNAGKVTVKEYQAWLDKQDIITAALKAHNILRTFYTRANKKLAEMDHERGGEWNIHIDDKHTLQNVTFMGIGNNTQTWHVWGELERENNSHTKTYDPSGVYEGQFNIEITHDLKGFDEYFYEGVVKDSPFMTDFTRITEQIAPLLAAEAKIDYTPPFYTYTPFNGGKSELAKLYHSDEMQVEVKVIPYIYQQTKVNFYLSDMDQDDTFSIPHSLQCLPEANVWKTGNINTSAFKANMDILYGFRGKFKQPTVPAIYPADAETTFSASVLGQYGGSVSSVDTTEFSEDDTQSGGSWRLVVGEDWDILRSLRGRTHFLISGGA